MPEPLTEEQKKRIEEAVAADAMELYGMAVYNYKFQEYYGEYNGFHIVEVYYDLEGGNWLTEVRRMITAGIYLGVGGPPPPCVGKNEKCCTWGGKGGAGPAFAVRAVCISISLSVSVFRSPSCNHTMMLTSRPGTTMNLRMGLPSTSGRMFSSASTASRI